LKACATARLDSLSAIDFSTSSNCLPPTVACVKALVMALANVLALMVSPLVLLFVFSMISGRSRGMRPDDVSSNP